MNTSELIVYLRSQPDSHFGIGASDTDVIAAETLLGVKIRGHYRDFLLHLGWGEIGNDDVFGLGQDVPSNQELCKLTRWEREESYIRLPGNLIPFSNDGCGNLSCIDTNTGMEPSVVFWNHELARDQVAEVINTDFQSWCMEIISWQDR